MIIGLMGPARAGKDTVADQLVREFKFVRVGLADEIKRTAKRWWGFTDQQLWGPSEFRNAPDPRIRVKCRDCAGGGEGAVRELTCGKCNGKGYTNLTPRHALQQLGGEVSRSVDPDVWIRIVLDTYERLQKGDVHYKMTTGLRPMVQGELVNRKSVVVSDCRHRNELMNIQRAGGKMIRVVRPGAGLTGHAAMHPSEREQLDIPDEAFDHILDNSGTLDELANRVQAIMGRWASV